jgi:hypothetical protein
MARACEQLSHRPGEGLRAGKRRYRIPIGAGFALNMQAPRTE